jgi:hypothetical protein
MDKVVAEIEEPRMSFIVMSWICIKTKNATEPDFLSFATRVSSLVGFHRSGSYIAT